MVSIEVAILIWLAIGAGIAGGVFLVARSAVQIGSVAFQLIEKRLTAAQARQQTALLAVALVAALVVTALIAGYAIWFIFGTLLESGQVGG